MKSELICIVCPMSCQITVEQDETTKEIRSVAGNTCPRGDKYARNELTHPMRQLTSTVAIKNAPYKRLPVILSGEISKDDIFNVMEQIHMASVTAPINKGDVIVKNVCGLNVDVVASRSMGTTYEL